MNEFSNTASCSARSASVHESLLGTAPHADLWLLLEYSGAFGRNALEDSSIPAAVKVHLQELAAQNPRAKVLLIRNQDTRPGKPLKLYLATGQHSEHPFALRTVTLDFYESLLAFPSTTQLLHLGQPCTQPLLLVCTNGRRDQCCSKFGVPLVAHLSNYASITTFECSHVGQHRFAPNILAFPGPYFYGRVTPNELPEFTTAITNQQVYLSRLRGNASLTPASQAAEYYYLLPLKAPSSLQVQAATEEMTSDGVIEVNLTTSTGALQIKLRQVIGDLPIQSSCEGTKTHFPSHFELE